MMKRDLLIGSHVAFKAIDYFVGSINESLLYGSNCMMIYTGAPQNMIRKPLDPENTKLAHELLKKNSIDPKNIIVHAPYIINLASGKTNTRELSKNFLINELKRVGDLGLKYLVLHPGSCLDQDRSVGIEQIIYGINYALEKANNDVWILLETMSGKGSELGINFNELKLIMDKIKFNKIGVCLDTCHMHESGIDITNVNKVLEEFDELIGIEYIKAIHLNDSKNKIGAKKDRHENLGYGHIGFDVLYNWYISEKLINVPKILETPYYEKEKKILPPYKEEILMLRNKKWYNFK
ncbi:MAG: deoxyribonuclease IV [Mycoplasmoidaceae bacterium]